MWLVGACAADEPDHVRCASLDDAGHGQCISDTRGENCDDPDPDDECEEDCARFEHPRLREFECDPRMPCRVRDDMALCVGHAGGPCASVCDDGASCVNYGADGIGECVAD